MFFQNPQNPALNIPDDLTMPQFILDSTHELRPKRGPGVPWLIEDETGRKVGEEELRKRTQALANGLKRKFQIGEDDVVLLFSRNHIDYPTAIWATHRLGGIISGANPDFSSNELLYQIEQTKPAALIVHPDALGVALSAAKDANIPEDRIVCFNVKGANYQGHLTVEDLAQDGFSNPNSFIERKLAPGEAKTKLAFLSFSSGTTGKPKAVAISHYAPIANVIQMAAHNNVNKNYCDFKDQRYRPGDIAIGVLPLYHIYGLVINLHLVLFSAMSLVIVPKFNFVQMLESIVRHRISHLFLVPPMAVLLCKHPAVKNYDLRSCIRMIMCGAAPLSHEINHKLFELLPDAHIGQAYGMTELSTAICMWSIEKKRGTSGSAGQISPGCTVKIVKPDGSLAGYNEPGELYVLTPSAALRYQNNEEATKETFIDGWVRTGDEARVDENSEVWILDRLKEIMKVKGFQVAPAELEGCILECSFVDAACVVGIPDDYSGEVPLAFVVLTPDAQRRAAKSPAEANKIKAAVMKHVADNKVAYKQLAGGVEFIAAIPTSPSGKLLRRVLRDQAKQMRSNTIKAKL